MASVLSVGVTQGLVSVFLRERLWVSMICGANLRGLGVSVLDSIGCASERLPAPAPDPAPEPEAEDDVIASGEWSCDVLSLLELREYLIVVSTGWGKARRAFVPLVPRWAEGGFVDLFGSSIDWGGMIGLKCCMMMRIRMMIVDEDEDEDDDDDDDEDDDDEE